MPTQLRIYTIENESMDQWVYFWKTKVKPLRKKMGFKIEHAWRADDSNQFIWILSHCGPGSWESYDQAYYESFERQSFSPDPCRFIVGIQKRFLDRL